MLLGDGFKCGCDRAFSVQSICLAWRCAEKVRTGCVWETKKGYVWLSLVNVKSVKNAMPQCELTFQKDFYLVCQWHCFAAIKK